MDPHFDGVLFKTHAAELKRRLRYPFPPFRVLDIRPREEYERGRIPGAVLVSLPHLASGLPEGAEGRVELIVYGRGPDDAAVRAASLALMRHGAHRIVEFPGGMYEWELDGYPTEGTKRSEAGGETASAAA
jgi:rhodanese-related sulfurtransferase